MAGESLTPPSIAPGPEWAGRGGQAAAPTRCGRLTPAEGENSSASRKPLEKLRARRRDGSQGLSRPRHPAPPPPPRPRGRAPRTARQEKRQTKSDQPTS